MRFEFSQKNLFVSLFAGLILIKLIYVGGLLTSSYLFASYILIMCFILGIGLFMNDAIVKKGPKKIFFFLTLYYFLFSTIFSNPLLRNETIDYALSSFFNYFILFLSVLYIKHFRCIIEVLKTVFFTISLVLIFQFALNITDINLSGLINIFDKSARERVSFGFVHPNTLGITCTFTIAISSFFNKSNTGRKTLFLIRFLLAPILLMLLSSASRSSITSLVLFYICRIYFIYQQSNKFHARLLNRLCFWSLIILIIGAISYISFDEILYESNRSALFNVSLPRFLSSDRTLFGYGLIHHDLYGLGKTPYYTLWLDNGYIYTFIASGYVGSIYIFILLSYFCYKIFNVRRNPRIRAITISLFVIYLYGALFEASLFNSDFLSTNIVFPIILVYISERRKNIDDHDFEKLFQKDEMINLTV